MRRKELLRASMKHKERLELFLEDFIAFGVVTGLFGSTALSMGLFIIRSPVLCLLAFLLVAFWFITFTKMNIIRSILVIWDKRTQDFQEVEAVFKQQLMKYPGAALGSEYKDEYGYTKTLRPFFYEIIAKTEDNYLFCTATRELPLKPRKRYTFVIGARSHAVLDVLDEQGKSIWPIGVTYRVD